MNDDFNNFFDDQRPEAQPETPVYHSPEPKRGKPNTAVIISIVVSIVMCLVVLANVLILATLKNSIAEQYSDSLSASMKEKYAQAINEALNNSDIVDDVVEQATANALLELDSSVGNIANTKVAKSVAKLSMTATDGSSGTASGFLITDTDSTGTLQRYLVTNAHCVRYEKQSRSSGGFSSWGFVGSKSYSWASYSSIKCVFENDSTVYELEIVAYGAYTGDYLSAENSQPDLAILRIVGDQPSNEEHPSIEIVYDDNAVNRGMEVAIVGSPQGVQNSISVGVVSQTGITISSWGSGTFIMTDAAINGGNSGGPMVNSLGKVVGVVESKLVSEGVENMGFALSVSTLRDFIDWASVASNNELHTNLTIELK